MKKILVLCMLAYSGVCLAAYPGKLDVYALLLVSSNPDDVKMGARSVQQEGIKDSGLLDLTAERMCIYVRADGDAGMDDSDNADTVSWLAKALGGSGDAKYRPLLEEALQKTTRDKNKKYIGEALALLPAVVAAAPASACPTLEGIRAQVLEGRTPAKVSLDDANGVKKGDTLDSVYQKLGAPTTARHFDFSKFIPFFGHMTLNDMDISYLGAATILFDYDNPWQVAEVIPNVDLALDPKSPDAALFDAVLSGQMGVVKQAAGDMNDAKQFPVDVLDVAAGRIWKQRDTTDSDQLDALEELCELLGDSGNPRYRTILTQVSQQAKVKRLSKYATEALDVLPAGDAEQFPVPARP